MNVFTWLAYAMGLSVLLAAGAAATLVEQYTQYLPAGTNLAMIAQRVGDSQPIVEYQGQQMALPASTQKVVTALAALLQLGPDFRFTTSLETKGHVEGTTLKGDLITRFTGDPTLTRQQIRNMVNELRKAGVQAIDGDLVIDISAFASHDKAPGWVWNDLTQCFSAPPGAAIIDRNCFSVTLYQGKNPAIPPISAPRSIIRSICSVRSKPSNAALPKGVSVSWMWCRVN